LPRSKNSVKQPREIWTELLGKIGQVRGTGGCDLEEHATLDLLQRWSSAQRGTLGLALSIRKVNFYCSIELRLVQILIPNVATACCAIARGNFGSNAAVGACGISAVLRETFILYYRARPIAIERKKLDSPIQRAEPKILSASLFSGIREAS
jgi:hypothetical protein